jgi:superoxide dismutase, Fe-Mn family
MVHELPDLPYGFDALEPHIDAETMEIHHGKHHKGYVDKLNKALEGTGLEDKPIGELLKDVDSLPSDKRQAVINNGGGHANHSLFWEIMCPEGKGGKPSGSLMEAIKEAFGSGERCHDKFVESAVKHFGSGWCWLAINESKGLEIFTTPNQDSPLMQGKTPILGLDVWEHAYYLKYQNKRQEYVEAFVKVINWDKVSELFEKAKG